MAMAGCLGISSCGSALARSTFTPSSVHQVSLRSERIALLKAPVLFGTGIKRREGTRRTTQLARRVPCSATRAGLGDDQNKEKTSPSQFTSAEKRRKNPEQFKQQLMLFLKFTLFEEDWVYLGKVFAGCTAGAGAIKFGSILLPQITQPNLAIALLIVTAPVVASVVVLNAASSKSSDS